MLTKEQTDAARILGIPDWIVEALLEERRARATGTVELHFKDGSIADGKLIRLLKRGELSR